MKQRRFELWFLPCLLSSRKAYWCVWLWWTVWIAVCLASHYMHCFTVSISYPFIHSLFCALFVSSISCFLPPLQQASYAASSLSSVSYCVQQTKVPFTPEDTGATQGLTMSVSNSFLNRHSSFPVHSVSCSLHFNTCVVFVSVKLLCANSVLTLTVAGKAEGSFWGFWTHVVIPRWEELCVNPTKWSTGEGGLSLYKHQYWHWRWGTDEGELACVPRHTSLTYMFPRLHIRAAESFCSVA